MTMRPGHIKLPKPPGAEAAEAARAAGYERKQQWKELPGNCYTPENLRMPPCVESRRKAGSCKAPNLTHPY